MKRRSDPGLLVVDLIERVVERRQTGRLLARPSIESKSFPDGVALDSGAATDERVPLVLQLASHLREFAHPEASPERVVRRDPTLANLGRGSGEILLFVAAMIAGTLIHPLGASRRGAVDSGSIA
jgi:hypothetical protein